MSVIGETSVVSSSSEVCGDMNRAVGRGPVLEGPLLFLSIGGGMAATDFERLEECRSLEESLSCLPCIAVVLAAPGPRVREVVCNRYLSNKFNISGFDPYRSTTRLIAI